MEFSSYFTSKHFTIGAVYNSVDLKQKFKAKKKTHQWHLTGLKMPTRIIVHVQTHAGGDQTHLAAPRSSTSNHCPISSTAGRCWQWTFFLISEPTGVY